MAARSPPEKIFEKPFDTVSSDGAVAGVSVNATAEPAGVNPATSWSPTTSSDDSYAEADFVQIAPTGAGICRIEPLRDGRGRWGIADRSGRIIEAHHLSRDSAEQQCRRLVEAGII